MDLYIMPVFMITSYTLCHRCAHYGFLEKIFYAYANVSTGQTRE